MPPITPGPDRPLFAALLTPHRAMDRGAVRWFIAFTAILASVPGLIFFAMGAWPIVGFLGLDVLLLYWALSASLKSGKAFEEVTLWPDTLELRQVSPQGRDETISFNPFFVRFAVVRDSDDRIIALRLISRNREIEIGRFLNADDKARFAAIFAPALNRAKA